MLYFDNAATGERKPDAVLNAVFSSLKRNANVGRSGHKASTERAKRVLECRKILSDFFDGYGFERTVFTKNCTEAINLLFTTLEQGDHVVTTAMEHNSVLRPLTRLSNDGVISLSICPAPDGKLQTTELLSHVRSDTKAVVVTTASNVTGERTPLTEIGEKLPKDVLLYCDGAQGCGHFPIHMKKTRIDALAVAGHKGMLGIQGSGALLFSNRVFPKPLLYGGTGTTSHLLTMPDFYPDALEAGTLSYPAVLSLLEGTRHLLCHQTEYTQKTYALTEFFLRKLKRLHGYTAYARPNPSGIVALSHRAYSSQYLEETLSSTYDVATRGGLHCAPEMHRALGTMETGLLRVSFSPFNEKAEILVLLSALRQIDERCP